MAYDAELRTLDPAVEVFSPGGYDTVLPALRKRSYSQHHHDDHSCRPREVAEERLCLHDSSCSPSCLQNRSLHRNAGTVSTLCKTSLLRCFCYVLACGTLLHRPLQRQQNIPRTIKWTRLLFGLRDSNHARFRIVYQRLNALQGVSDGVSPSIRSARGTTSCSTLWCTSLCAVAARTNAQRSVSLQMHALETQCTKWTTAEHELLRCAGTKNRSLHQLLILVTFKLCTCTTHQVWHAHVAMLASSKGTAGFLRLQRRACLEGLQCFSRPIILRVQHGEKCLVRSMAAGKVTDVRHLKVNVYSHRSDIISCFVLMQTRQFGPFPIDDSQSFAETKLSFAFVNIKPVVPGHVLISPHRVVQSFEDLTAEEVSDLWQGLTLCMYTTHAVLVY